MPTCFNFDAYNFKLILTRGANTDFGHPSKYAEQTDNIFPSKITNMPSKLQILSEQTENSFPSKIANMPSKLQILSEQTENYFPSKITNMPSKLQILSEQTENTFPSKITNMPSKLQILSEQSQIIGDKPILTVIADKIFGGLELSPIGEADFW